MSLDVAELMRCLASKRPIFHSEADFQHALAWELHKLFPDSDVRLELPRDASGESLHLDLWLAKPALGIAIELKYKTRALSVEVSGERFCLKDQSAQDQGRYGFLKDVERVERITANCLGASGYAILLSNDSSYWKPSKKNNAVDAAFRLHEDRSIEGTLAWASHASPGTMDSREEPIVLASNYRAHWYDYSRVDSSSYGAFRYLAFPVGRTAESPQQ